MDSTIPAVVALSIPSTPATVTTGNPHWPIRDQRKLEVRFTQEKNTLTATFTHHHHL